MAALARSVLRYSARHEAAASDSFAAHVIHGLSDSSKWLSAKYFYDAAGSALFEQITDLPEYYPTRTELRILHDHAREMAGYIPLSAALVEFGTGSTRKARILIDAAPQLAAYVPVDISAEFLNQEAVAVRRDFPWLAVLPLVADFTRDFDLPSQIRSRPRVGFFPGSTIGNFEPDDAAEFLRQAGRILGVGATMIVGVDRIKDTAVLNAAYDDAAGVTAKFNLNVLTRMNRELGGNFDLSAFRHRAFYNAEEHRIEMHLESLKDQSATVAGRTFDFRKGETIHTENSYKYTVESFRTLAEAAGWRPVATWTDEKDYFAVHALKL
ncbi:MAG: L-histidine N(alpha)-methyltransferase [Alphaproteobacteria bacterium]|nr:MAG: L-histidine N(alpha)-methyltransferase [Alphaproteobacteria bacterium]